MVKDPYKVLDLPKDSLPEVLEKRYNELKARYGEQRFMYGDAGTEGARLLMELEEAWAMIAVDIEKSKAREQFGGDMGHIDDLIKKGRYDEAQALLDAINERGGEWHYLQSIIFYKRDWLTECRKQLKMAVEFEPGNQKYRAALEKLETVMGSGNTRAESMGSGQQTVHIEQQDNAAQQTGNCLSTFCCAWCLSDLCCSLLRCC